MAKYCLSFFWFTFIVLFFHSTQNMVHEHVRSGMSKHWSAHINKHPTATLIQKSLNMHLLLITLEINSSGSAVTGARCYWQTAVAVTDNMRYLSIPYCNPPIRLSLSPSASNIPCFLVLLLRALLSPSVRWSEEWYQNQNICHNPPKLNYIQVNFKEVDNKRGWLSAVFMK